jgi:hypothetical protein
VAYTGKHVGTDSTSGNAQYFDPFENAQCVGDVRPRCRPLYGSGDGVNDVLEYWFGAGLVNIGAGVDDDGNPFEVLGVDDPFSGLSWGFNGPDSAQNQVANPELVHHDERVATARPVSAVQELGRGQV